MLLPNIGRRINAMSMGHSLGSFWGKSQHAAPIQIIPHVSLSWLLLAQLLVIAPHLLYQPPWVIALWGVAATWRWQIYRMRYAFPSFYTKAILVIALGIGVYFSRGSLLGMEGGALLLVATFTIKLIELKTRRDAFIVIFLGYFIIATSFLFQTSLVLAAYSLIPLLVLTAALIGLQHTSYQHIDSRLLIKQAGSLLLQAIPIMLVLFLFFPRIDPLWSMPNPKQKQQAKTGLSDSMSPGDVADLARSNERAFRASFTQAVPPQQSLYWRALTLSHFDGRSWVPRISNISKARPSPVWQKMGDAIAYSVVMEPTDRDWLFTLAISESTDSAVQLISDFNLRHSLPIIQPYRYDVTAWPQAAMRESLSAAQQAQLSALPPQYNAQTIALAQQLYQQSPNPEDFAAAILHYFNENEFYYTLQPPVLGRDSVDDFLFRSRRGFCEHYASAAAVMLRAAHIPARVITGYQGGVVDQANQYVLVRQQDAHAWVEYWTEQKGWLRLDPTAAVAPNRIEMGIDAALSADEVDTFALNPHKPGLIAMLQKQWEYINYQWTYWVLGYENKQQDSLLNALLGYVSWRAMILILCFSVLALLSMALLWINKPWRKTTHPILRLYQRLTLQLVRVGVPLYAGDTPRAVAHKTKQCFPQHADMIDQIINDFEQCHYAAHDLTPDIKKLRLLVGRFIWRLRWSFRSVH